MSSKIASATEAIETAKGLEPVRLMIYTLLALAPLPLASVRPTWQWLWVAFVGLAVLVYVIQTWRQSPPRLPKYLSTAIVIVGFFVLWSFAQASTFFGSGVPISIDAVDHLLGALNSLSVDPQKNVSNAAFFLSHLVFFYLVFSFCSRRAKAVQLLRFCGILVAIYAAYGFVNFVSGNDTILWFEKWAYRSSLTSTFVNRNSFAAFSGLGLQCLIAYAFFWMQNELIEGRSGRELYRDIIEAMVTKAWWLPLAIVLTAIALLLTNSRAGFGSVAIATLMLIIISPNTYQRSGGLGRRLAGYGFLVAVAAGLFGLSGEMLETRLQADASFDQRFSIYPLALDAIADRPWTGFGLGTFDDVFRLYRDETITAYFTRAHNDYLELALTAGIPAAVLLLIACMILVQFLVQRLRFGVQYRSFIALGITCSAQLGLHSLVDFSLQMPAVSYLWCAILAASVALAYRCELAEKADTRV